MPKFDAHPVCRTKSASIFLLVCFSAMNAFTQSYPVDTLKQNGSRSNRINMVYLGEGYVNAELPAFITNSNTINNTFFSQTPFKEYKDFFNAYAVRVPSNASGAKHPGTASDESSSGGQPVINPDNFFRSTFDYSSIHRLLVPQNNAGINSVLATNLPDYDQVVVVVNSTYYGGSGGAFATASINAASAEIALHEIGHSFAGLADEYWAGDVYAAEKPNMTKNNDPATVKWKNWYGINAIGIYPYGTSGNPALWYKPHQACKMQYLNYPFCSVCTERLIDRIHELTTMIDSYTPASTSFSLANTNPVSFSIASISASLTTLTVRWYLNGNATPFAMSQNAVTIPFTNLNSGINTVRAEMTDNSPLSKSYLPSVGYINNITWTVNKPAALPIRLTGFAGKVVNGLAQLNWEIDQPADVENFDIETSRDGVTFSKVTSLGGQARNKTYSFTDLNTLAPLAYYRLHIYEKGGHAFYSDILKLQNPFDKFYYKVFQQPETHRYHLSTALTIPQNISIRVLDVNGSLVQAKNFGMVTDQLNYDLDLSGKPAGIYLLNISIGNNNYTSQLLAK